MRLCLIITASLSLSLAAPALADEGGGDGVDQPITTESSAPSAQAQESESQVLELVYCDNIELGHPDLERCEVFLEELAAEEELALEESMYMEAPAEELRNLDEMVGRPGLIAAEGSEQDRFYNRPSRTIVFGAGGLIVGFFTPAILMNVPYMDLTDLLLGAAIGGVVGATICGIYGYRSWKGHDSPRSLSVSPYRHDNASGLMFSGQF